ncbi:MAG: amidohydrolase family protein [Rhodospirillaceae bacterium]|nr:amidohydrolase family protein [Rhodospirillaceae bacterium]
MRIDAHQHYWQLARGDYGWLTPKLAPIYRDFGPGDLAPRLDAFDIACTILVQAAPTQAETRFMLDLAATTPSVAGVVGWADMEAPDAAEHIARLATRPKLVGIRPMIHDIADPRWMLSPALSPAYAAIETAGLVFDALVRPVHLGSLETLVGRHPGLSVVIDHGAKPDVARWTPGDEDFADWAERMHRLGRRTNVVCKTSGLVTEARPDWEPGDLIPYLDVLLDAFGPEGLLFGSDWPVVNLAGGYDRWTNALLGWLDRLDTSSRAMILGETASRIYKLTER